jgi:hypothetical protein
MPWELSTSMYAVAIIQMNQGKMNLKVHLINPFTFNLVLPKGKMRAIRDGMEADNTFFAMEK